MLFPKNILAQTIIDLCYKKGLKNVVISPGSRNAPLTLGFINNNFFKTYSIVDERSAAFFALGISQQTKLPTILVCTSGSALLNYYPAISEAYFSNIPLIVLSADRPSKFLNIGDGQTINQKNVFRNNIGYSTELVDYKKSFFKFFFNFSKNNNFRINKAINISLEKNTPVHINIPLSEPLYELVKNKTVETHNVKRKSVFRSNVNFKNLKNKWFLSIKKIVLIGVLNPNSLSKKTILNLANDPSVLVLTENTSNVHHTSFYNKIDHLIASLNQNQISKFKPDILVSIGGMIISKKIKNLFRDFNKVEHWHVGTNKALNTYFSLKKHVNVDVNIFFDRIYATKNKTISKYQSYWDNIVEIRSIKHKSYLSTLEFCDFKIYEAILRSLPSDSILHLSNSSTIRYSQLFDINHSINVFCNRGTSGIDGSTSTAIGASVVSNKQTTIITGDLSFFYDNNALWNSYIPSNFRIIIINNKGGGIFKILTTKNDTEDFENYFETKHSLLANNLSKMHDLEYYQADSLANLKSSLIQFYKISKKPKILEVVSSNKNNHKLLLNYFSNLQ